MTLALGERRLYLCTPVRDDLVRFVEACLDGGVDVVQLRDKDHEARELLASAAELAVLCRDRGVPFLVNDRPDLALASGADGVHVGQDDLPATWCRRILGADAIVGVSTHSAADLDRALDEVAALSYLSAGPITATPTKPGRPGTGVEYAARATARAPVPVFVTGGVDAGTVGGLVEAGLGHFVVVRALTEARDPRAAARRLREAIDEALART